ncbi:MAG: rhodanese-like domain-containing protein [Chloroflexota bacterium]
MNRKRVAILFLLGLLLVACQSNPVTGEDVAVAGGSYKNVSPRELNTLLKDKDFIFVNVHIPFAGEIVGTDLSIPYDQIEQNLSQLPAEKDARIVLYCRSGHMSQIAAEKLVALGYTDVWNLKGGMVNWEKEGFELQK